MTYKKLCLFPLIIFAPIFSVAQTDSINIVKSKWQSQKIGRGIKLKQHSFPSLFNSCQNVSILEVKPRRKVKIDLGYEPKQLKPTSEFGISSNAVAALNGTFFDIQNGGSVDYIRSDERVINTNRLGKNNERAMHQKSAVAITDGKVNIAVWDGTENWEERLEGEDIMVTGPPLITKEERLALDSSSFVLTRHPRSAVALKGRKVLLITIDGRNDNAAGMSLFELASFLKWNKVDEAINLDGGGSTTLWVKGQPDNGIINYPSDNKKWDHAGERNVANVILVKKGN
jgi:exopolysaccharide biosynthesis protein